MDLCSRPREPGRSPAVRPRRVVTDRRGGRLRRPYDSFNLGGHVGDDPAAVAANRDRLAGELGRPPRLVWMTQVHGTGVAIVEDAEENPVADVDALVTATPGLVLCVLVADCVPVLLADPVAGVVAAVHAGREGVRRGRPAALAAMTRLGARPGDVEALLGPAVCGLDYEVPAACRPRWPRSPRQRGAHPAGHAGLDLRAGIAEVLRGPASARWCTTRGARSRTRGCSATAATA